MGGSSELTDAGIILKTINGGKIWQLNVHPASATGMGVYFTDHLHGYVVGSNPPFFEGVIMRTEDGGVNWEIQYLPCSWLNDVVFTDYTTGWVVGDYGFIWYTEDSGNAWTRIESGTHADLNRIVFVENGDVGFIFGEDNTLLRYDRTGSDIKEEDVIISSVFKLYQNYPNPFNSTTMITYRINKPFDVSLTILDTNGNEVIQLINQKQSVGEYNINWDSKNKNGKYVSSGLYYYVFKSGNLSETKKMLLIR